MTQQTAVEWLIEQLIKADKELDGRRKNEDATILKLNPTKLFEQAKAMEKEQMILFYLEGCKNSYGIDAHEKYDRIDGENYYNKNYKKDK